MTVDVCDVCGSTNIKEIKCKVICQNCGTILKTCADLDGEASFFAASLLGVAFLVSRRVVGRGILFGD